MNTKISIDKKTIELLHKRYKKYFLPVGVFLLSVILFFFIVVPQFGDYTKSRQQASTASEHLNITQGNVQLLSSLDERTLDDDSAIVSQALPPGKDFVSILNAISSAGDRSGTALGDYTFQVGDVAGLTNKENASVPTLQLNINIVGSARDASKFLSELAKTLPLSEATSVKFGNSGTSIMLSFYFKPFPHYNFNSSTELHSLSKDQQSLLQTIATFHAPTSGVPQ